MSRWTRRNGIDKLERQWNNDTSYIRGLIDASPRSRWPVSRVIHPFAAALVAWVGIAAPAFAQVSDQPGAVPAYTLTPERITASSAVLVALIGAIIGGLALVRSVRRIGNHGRSGAIVALVTGPIGLVVGGLVVATADGGLGTGNGLAGGVVAMMVGLIGTALGWLALSRSRGTA